MRFNIDDNGVFIFVMGVHWFTLIGPTLLTLGFIVAYNIYGNWKRGKIIEGYDEAWIALGNLIPTLKRKEVFGSTRYGYYHDEVILDPKKIVEAQELFDKRKQQGIDYARITELKRIFKKINQPEE